MAMNQDMDELLRLYRHASNEAPTAAIDARILRAAERITVTRRWSRRIVWPAAIAASLLLVVGWPTPRHPGAQASDPMAAYDAGMTRSELLRMDVMPPASEADRFVLDAPHSHPNPMTGNAP